MKVQIFPSNDNSHVDMAPAVHFAFCISYIILSVKLTKLMKVNAEYQSECVGHMSMNICVCRER